MLCGLTKLQTILESNLNEVFQTQHSTALLGYILNMIILSQMRKEKNVGHFPEAKLPFCVPFCALP